MEHEFGHVLGGDHPFAADNPARTAQVLPDHPNRQVNAFGWAMDDERRTNLG